MEQLRSYPGLARCRVSGPTGSSALCSPTRSRRSCLHLTALAVALICFQHATHCLLAAGDGRDETTPTANKQADDKARETQWKAFLSRLRDQENLYQDYSATVKSVRHFNSPANLRGNDG